MQLYPSENVYQAQKDPWLVGWFDTPPLWPQLGIDSILSIVRRPKWPIAGC